LREILTIINTALIQEEGRPMKMDKKISINNKTATRTVKKLTGGDKLEKKIEERILSALGKSSEMVKNIRADRLIDPKKLHKPFDL
jgi:hypothetical protein